MIDHQLPLHKTPQMWIFPACHRASVRVSRGAMRTGRPPEDLNKDREATVSREQ